MPQPGAETELVPVASLAEFFHDSVHAAMTANKVAVEGHTAHYVVNLLTCFARSEALFDQTADGPRLKPLALMLAEAAEAGPLSERNAALRRLGDVALFIAGFMADALERSPVGIDYYVRMGGCAYHSLAQSLPDSTRGRAFAPIFAELAVRFTDMVDVLADVRYTAAGARDQDVLRLYETWMKTGSRRATRLLGERGIQPVLQPGSTRPH